MILRNFIEKLPNKITNIKIIFKYTIIQIILFKIKQIKSKIKISSSILLLLFKIFDKMKSPDFIVSSFTSFFL